MHVAQAAPGLLQVGLEQEGELAEALLALGRQGAQLRQPGAGPRPPVLERPLAQPGAQPGIAGDGPRVEQPEGHLEVGRRDRLASAGVRTEWSRRTPESQTGYQIRSAMPADAGHALVQQ